MNNHQWVLARKPLEGWPHSDDFNWLSGQMPEIGANQILTRTIYLSLDPYPVSYTHLTLPTIYSV